MKLIKPSFEIIKWNENILLTLEEIGRVCYKSENAITEGSADKFIKMLIGRGHESVLEHARISFLVQTEFEYDILEVIDRTIGCEYSYIDHNNYIVSMNIRTLRDALRLYNPIFGYSLALEVNKEYPILVSDLLDSLLNIKWDPVLSMYETEILSNQEVLNLLSASEASKHVSETVRIICDRGVSHEFVRHRVASFSQESTRYCDYKGEMQFIIPFWVDLTSPFKNTNLAWYQSMEYLEEMYKYVRKNGWKPEEARSLLPNSLKTEMCMSQTLVNWKHFYGLRAAAPAHPQARELAYPMLDSFTELYPEVF